LASTAALSRETSVKLTAQHTAPKSGGAAAISFLCPFRCGVIYMFSSAIVHSRLSSSVNKFLLFDDNDELITKLLDCHLLP
jgi:hypothetical protein